MDLSGVLKRFKDKRIGVLMGGMSSEREISIRSGENVFKALTNLSLTAVKIDVSRFVYQDLIREKIDVAFIVLHGKYGEDGAIQGFLEVMNIPYTGTGILGSSLGLNKTVTKRVLQSCSIPTPASVFFGGIELENIAGKIIDEIGLPVVLKPNCEGSSIGIQLVQTGQELEKVLPGFIKAYPDSFAEQYIRGREITIGLLGTVTDIRVLPILELKPKHEFYDFDAKYTQGMTSFEIPAVIREEKRRLIEKDCILAYRELHLAGVVRIDAILDQDENPYFLEVNTIPGMTDTSDVPAMAKAAGLTFEEIVAIILDGIPDERIG